MTRWMMWVVVLVGSRLVLAGDVVTVQDDASLHRSIRDAKPGQTIRIQPGTYRGGVFAEIRGTEGKPIIIEGADEKNPPLLEGGTNGIHLSNAAYVTLRHLHIRGATGNGINIDDGGNLTKFAGGIIVEHLTIEDIGPKGNCDGIKLSGLQNFTVRHCTVSGWGGNAIDLVGCRDGVIEYCTVRGKKGFTPATGPQLKGGTSNVTVRYCLFDRAAMRGINAGGSTGLQFFRPPDAAYEAKDLTIEHNVFIGGDTPVAFVGVDGAVFRHNTIIEPDKWVLRILQETKEERFTRCRNVMFERNLIVYRRSAVRTTANIGPDTLPETFTFRDNWWYCADAPDHRPELPTKEANGVYGRDPKLETNPEGWPTSTAAAREYGARLSGESK